MKDINFINLKEDPSPELSEKVISTWTIHRVLSGQQALNRVNQVVYIATHKDTVVGITTAYLSKIRQLNNNLMYVFRGMIIPGFRIPGLMVRLSKLTFKYLEEVSKKESSRPLGLIMEVENPKYKSLQLTTTPNEFSLMGFSQRGHPIYVKYFKRVYYK